MNARNVEDPIQREIVRVARERGLFIFHVPNGGQRSAREGAAFKRLGVVAGIPDLCILGDKGRTYWIEVKTKQGKLSGAQKDVTGQMVQKGHSIFVAMGLQQGLDIVDKIAELEGVEL